MTQQEQAAMDLLADEVMLLRGERDRLIETTDDLLEMNKALTSAALEQLADNDRQQSCIRALEATVAELQKAVRMVA